MKRRRLIRLQLQVGFSSSADNEAEVSELWRQMRELILADSILDST